MSKTRPISELAFREWWTPKEAGLVMGIHSAEKWRAFAMEGYIAWDYRGPSQKQIVLSAESCREFARNRSEARAKAVSEPEKLALTSRWLKPKSSRKL